MCTSHRFLLLPADEEFPWKNLTARTAQFSNVTPSAVAEKTRRTTLNAKSPSHRSRSYLLPANHEHLGRPRGAHRLLLNHPTPRNWSTAKIREMDDKTASCRRSRPLLPPANYEHPRRPRGTHGAVSPNHPTPWHSNPATFAKWMPSQPPAAATAAAAAAAAAGFCSLPTTSISEDPEAHHRLSFSIHCITCAWPCLSALR